MSLGRGRPIVWPWLLGAILLAVLPWTADAGELSGFVAVDTRLFPESRSLPEQDGRALQPSLVLKPEYRHDWRAGRDRLTVIPFARLDTIDDDRTHVDIRELSWLHVFDRWDLLVGVSKVFWGVTESRHLVDIINQTDLVEDPDGEDKLGQPMIRLAPLQDWGTLTLFVLPRFRERTFPGRAGRLRFSLPVDWTIELDARAFANVPPSDVLFAVRRDHFVQLRLAYFF